MRQCVAAPATCIKYLNCLQNETALAMLVYFETPSDYFVATNAANRKNGKKYFKSSTPRPYIAVSHVHNQKTVSLIAQYAKI